MTKTQGQRSSTPDRMLASAVTLLSESGPRSVTIDRVLNDSGAPRGSVYHHFPEGRDQIVVQAVRTAADVMTAYFAEISADHTPSECIDRLTDFWKSQLSSHAYTRGCPILATTVDDGDSIELQSIVENAFAAWKALIVNVLVTHGADAARARSVATLAIAAVEGGVAMCKATKTTEPLDDINIELQSVLRNIDDEPPKQRA